MDLPADQSHYGWYGVRAGWFGRGEEPGPFGITYPAPADDGAVLLRDSPAAPDDAGFLLGDPAAAEDRVRCALGDPAAAGDRAVLLLGGAPAAEDRALFLLGDPAAAGHGAVLLLGRAAAAQDRAEGLGYPAAAEHRASRPGQVAHGNGPEFPFTCCPRGRLTGDLRSVAGVRRHR